MRKGSHDAPSGGNTSNFFFSRKAMMVSVGWRSACAARAMLVRVTSFVVLRPSFRGMNGMGYMTFPLESSSSFAAATSLPLSAGSFGGFFAFVELLCGMRFSDITCSWKDSTVWVENSGAKSVGL